MSLLEAHMGAWIPYTASRSYPQIGHSDVSEVVYLYRLWLLEEAWSKQHGVGTITGRSGAR